MSTDLDGRTRVPSSPSIAVVGDGTVVTSDHAGQLEEGTTHGLYHADRRLVSRYRVTVDGVEPTLLRATRPAAGQLDAAFATAFDDHGDARGVLLRHRTVAGAVVDHYRLHRLVDGPALTLRVELAGDLAGALDVRAGRVPASALTLTPLDPRRLELRSGPGADGGEVPVLLVELEGPAPTIEPDGALSWSVEVAVGEVLELTVRFRPAGWQHAHARHDADHPGLAVDAADRRWSRSIAAAVDDLASLRMRHGDRRYTAAGAPWFLALFGRDTLLTSYAALPLGTGQALDTLEMLAAYQGTDHDPRTLEQPGRILHELRTGAQGVFGLEPGQAYYGTADATPLFVVLLAEAARWGADPQRVAALLPAARAAVTWCLEHGDIDADGFVEAVADPQGIANQGWKDSGDSMVHADGSFAEPPIALVEVQAYVYGALVGLAELERRVGEPDRAGWLEARAAQLRTRFRAAFLDDELGGPVMGLDRDKRPLRVTSSNMGHALWTGILAPSEAARVAARVTASDLLESWGIRTLGARERAYAAMVYHRGAIWPHDTAIIAHGLSRVGASEALSRVSTELLELSARFDHRLPELLGGFGRSELAEPVPYPVACSPQAWSAAAPLLLARAVLGLEPDVPAGVLHLDPIVGDLAGFALRGVAIGARDVDITVTPDGGVEVTGADDLEVVVGAAASV